MSISQSSDPTSMESQQFIPTALEVKNPPKPHPLVNSDGLKNLHTKNLHFSPQPGNRNSIFKEMRIFAPRGISDPENCRCIQGGEVPHQGQWSALLSCKRFSSIFYSYTSRLYYCIFLPNGKCWDITKKKDPGKLKPWLELLLMQDLKCSFFLLQCLILLYWKKNGFIFHSFDNLTKRSFYPKIRN